MEKAKILQQDQFEELQEAGIEAYRNKDYEAALKYFTAALTKRKSFSVHGRPNPKRYELLNLRAAVYQRVDGKLEEAAKDAKRMIRLDERSVPGYLRAGKVLGLMGKWEAALKMYRYGLEKVPEMNNEKKSLVMMCEKVEAKVQALRNDAKRQDPLATLPLELIDIIMSGVDFRSIIRSQRVCKSWRDFLRNSYYYTYHKLDFSKAVTAPKKRTIETYINLSQGRSPIEEIIFSRLTTENEVEPSLVKKFFSQYPSIHTLLIPGRLERCASTEYLGGCASQLQTLILECNIDIRTVAQVLQTCKHLRRLECHSMDCERTWEIKDVTPIECPNLESILLKNFCPGKIYPPSHASAFDIASAPNLRSIKLINWGVNPRAFFGSCNFTGYRHLEELQMSGFAFTPLLPPSIKYLTFERPSNILESIYYCLPNLHTLNLTDSRYVKISQVSNIFSHLTSPSPLRVLNLSRNPYIDVSELSWLLQGGHCDYLEELYLSGLTTFEDSVTREMGRLAWLKRIDISQTRITGVGLLNIINGVGRKRAEMMGREKGVEWVKVEECFGVGLDAIMLARKLGVEIHYLAPRREGVKGKKIRYGD